MKKERVRSMRDIPTVQGLRNRSVPASREQAVAEVARLEHEKARLERELDIWLVNQRNTEKRLRQVEERLAGLEQTLNPPDSDGATKRQVRRTPTETAGGGEEEIQKWREIPLEY
jgi:predicted  nucleic acid-binding Zn-ribbon protein